MNICGNPLDICTTHMLEDPRYQDNVAVWVYDNSRFTTNTISGLLWPLRMQKSRNCPLRKEPQSIILPKHSAILCFTISGDLTINKNDDYIDGNRQQCSTDN